MSTTIPAWLEGRFALVVGDSAGCDAVAGGLAAAGAQVSRATYATSHDEAAAAIASVPGQVSILVHDTVAVLGSPDKLSLEQWRLGLNAGLDSRFFYAASMGRQSIGGRYPASVLLLDPPEQALGSAHAAAAGATGNLLKTLSVEWARDGFRVNSVQSRHFIGDLPDEQAQSLANLAAYLASDYGAYITGCAMGLDEQP